MTNHEKQIAKQCRKRAADKWGKAWLLLGEDLQRNAIASEVVSVLLQLHAETDIRYIQMIASGAIYPECFDLTETTTAKYRAKQTVENKG